MFDTFNYDEKDNRLLPINLNKGVPGLFEYEIGRKIIIEIVALRAKTYAYLTDGYNDGDDDDDDDDDEDYDEKRR